MAHVPTHVVPVATLEGFVTEIFRHAGCDATEAAAITTGLIGANLTGHDSHGVIRVPRYVDDVRTGRTLLGQKITIIAESPTHAVVDGNHGFGQTIGPQAVDIGVAKARATGMALVTLSNSAHLGRIGEWGERAADAGMVAIHFCNGANSTLVAPFGGNGRRLSTNPFCIAIPPMAGRPMLLLDMATSVVAEGKVFVASNGGKPLPEGALIGADGRPSEDPAVLYGPLVPNGPRDPGNGTGAIRAFGEHKGSGLSFMVEILAGMLSGGGTGGPVHGIFANNMLSIYLDPVRFGATDLARQAEEFAAYTRTSPTAAGVEQVLVPGEPEARNRAERKANGVPLQVDVWVNLCNVAREFGIAIPD